VATALILILVALLFLAAFILLRAALFPQPGKAVEPVEAIEVEDLVVAEHLSRVIQFPSISSEDQDKVQRRAFGEMLRALERMYPRTFSVLHPEVVNELSLLFTWPGSDPQRLPILLCTHSDVAPVSPGEEVEWTHPPFAGIIANGYVWGRGVLDDKANLVAILEAVEWLLRSGFAPKRTLYLAIGHDGELGGFQSMASIAALLLERGTRLEMALGRGGWVANGLIPTVQGPVALLGVSEKGVLRLALSAEAPGGQAAIPPEETAAGILVKALYRLEQHLFPPRLKFIRPAFARLGGELPFVSRMAFANLWLFGGLAARILSQTAFGNTLARTTIAVTGFYGGQGGVNLPRLARAVIDVRLMPGESIAGAQARIESIIADRRVSIEAFGTHPAWEPSPISDRQSESYRMLETSIRQIFPEAAAVSFVTPDATDAHYFEGISRQVYRFSPLYLEADDVARLRGRDERIAVKDCGKMVRFYVNLINNYSYLPSD
jgi:carboxypeptidase PM20D1